MPQQRIPLALKLSYTAFMAVLLPVYWYNYGPTNFLYFCDVCLFLTLVALWTESKLLASMCAVGILLPQLLWVTDFVAGCLGTPLTGMTDYMFHAHKSLFLRGLSMFHGWIPFLLIYLVLVLGYDRRALVAWTILAWVLLLVGYFLLPAGPAPVDNPNLPVNVNYVFGMDDNKPQSMMPPLLWLATLLIGLPVALYMPTHFLLIGLTRWWERRTTSHLRS